MDLEQFSFSEREKDVVRLLAQGLGNKQIAQRLGISTRTVEFHLSSVYARLGVSSRAEAIVRLAGADLRETAGGEPVVTAVDPADGRTENGRKSIFRRPAVRKYYPVLLLCLFITGAAAYLRSTRQLPAAQPSSTPPASMPTAQVNLPAAASLTASPVPAAEAPIPPHTVNGYTADIRLAYADETHVIFLVAVSGAGMVPGTLRYFERVSMDALYDQSGALINASSGFGPAVDPALIQFEFVPLTLLKGERLKGQFAFDVVDAPDYAHILAQFRFDFDLPIQPDLRFNPRQSVSANGLDMLLDSVTVTPDFTQVYLCFPPVTYAPWTLGSQTTLEIDGKQAQPVYLRELFNSETSGDRRAGSEPYWSPPVKLGRCIKALFPAGSSAPASMRVSVPQLEKLDPDVLLNETLASAYPGMTLKQAYYTAIAERGGTYRGAWNFDVTLAPVR